MHKIEAKHNNRKSIRCITFTVFASLLMFLGCALIGLRIIYPAIQRTVHRIGTPGIDLMETVEIGGIQQVLYFRGQNTDNPVILFLHGGPGSPMIPLMHGFQYDWEYDFTIVQWDQRNAGKTYALNDPEAVRQTMSAQRVLEDAREVTQYVKQKLDKDRIIIMGHSWGSVLGTMLVQTYPEDFIAYISVGQGVDMMENERVGYCKVLEEARRAENQKDIAAIEALQPYPPPEGYSEAFNEKIMQLRVYQVKYHLAAGVDLMTTLQAITSPYYTFADIIRLISVDTLYYQGELMRFLADDFDAHDYDTHYTVPVYYIMGEHDWQTPYPLAKEFFEKISAPDKRFYSISDAGHMTMVDNKAEFTRVLLEDIRPLIQD